MKNQNGSRRFRLTIAYDGRPFEGWQSQPGGNTVQDVVEEAIASICPEIAPVLHGSGRTDAGVSAAGQTAHFDVPSDWGMDARQWLRALNAQLPPLIRVIDATEADSSFHARFNAKRKIYRYRIFCGEVLPPLEHGLAWHLRSLDPLQYTEAMQVFVGRHHFGAFSAKRRDGRDEGRDCERNIFELAPPDDVKPSPDWAVLDISGDGFLYKMVRFLAGTGVELTRGKLTEKKVQEWLATPQTKEKAPLCAPAAGLSLRKVSYE